MTADGGRAGPATCVTMVQDTPGFECGRPARYWLISPGGRVPVCHPCGRTYEDAIREDRMVTAEGDVPFPRGAVRLEAIDAEAEVAE